MSRLTNEQIHFINLYLESSGVKYGDIRYEMTDHVASALEGMKGEFYDNFKEYMVGHKTQLLESNKKFARIAWNKALKSLFVNMVSRPGVLIFGSLFSVFSLTTAYVGERTMSLVLEIIPLIIMIMVIVSWFSSNFSKQGRSWSGSDKILGIANFLAYILVAVIRPDILIDTVPVLMCYYSAVITFMIMAYVSHTKLRKKYKLQYNG